MSDMEMIRNAQPMQPEPEQGGVCIEIKCMPDGSCMVSEKPIEAEKPMEPGEEMEPSGKMAQSFGEALKMALDIYKNSNANTGDEQMNAGYSNG